ncbi:MAG: hypothetical protein ABI720_08760 [Actinomycetes bacterium]
MRLAPRDLQRAGMTGTVPHYGGRLTPTQAYAAGHRQSALPRQPERPPRTKSPATLEQSMVALRQLLDGGLITETEFDALMARRSP